MKKIIIFRRSIRQCELRAKEIGFTPSQCIFITSNYDVYKVKGYYKEVLNGEIALDSMNWEQFERFYFGG